MIRLRAMPQERLASWQERTLAAYAEDLASSSLTGEQIAQHVAESADELFPHCDLRDGHAVLEVVIDGQVGGHLWVGPSDSSDDLYVFDVEIDEPLRGRGHGRSAMESAEAIAAERGHRVVALTVADTNVVARGLYESLGYDTVAVAQGRRFMRKTL